MFKNLTNFAHKRNWKEAIGFYVSYLVAIVLLGSIAGSLFAGFASTAEEAFQNGMRAGAVMSILSCIGLSFVILKQKKMIKDFGYILLALLSGLLAALGGGLLGLLIPAYLSTLAHK